MRRELLTPFALSLGAALIAVSCSASDPSSGGEPDTSPTTGATPTTEPTAGTTAGTVAPNTSPEGSDTGGPQGFGTDRLNFFGECPALLEYMQTEASKRVTPWGLDGGFGPRLENGEVLATDDFAVAEESSADLAATAPAEVDFSGTNTQEIGVDEGDIVETDGSYVYVADQRGLQIVSVADAEVVAEPELPEGQQQMILDGTRLMVVTSGWSGASDTIVSTYDVSDPTAPELLRRTHLEGAVVATRSADGVARLVISTSLQERLPFVQPTQFGLDEELALERNRQIIEQSEVEDWLPRWFDEAGDGTFGPMQQALDCEDVAAPRDFSGLGITWIASVDLQGTVDPVGSAGIVSTGDTVYASPTNLYIATQNWVWQFESGDFDADDEEETSVAPGAPPTLIHQFALGTGTEAAYVASGEVDGRLLNQFAMSEHNGDLRVATTTEEFGFGEQSESTVFVLRPDGQDLRVISSVSGLGRDERIFAVRFLGDVGYVVTFRQTDPLYVVDLSDPENPVLDGELKIPGYSAYLHPVSEDLLLGVGQDATDEGRALGTQLSLFDVSDPTDPQRIDSLTIGGWSEVEWDHKAFLFWEPDGTIVLPVSPGWGDCPPGQACLAEEIKSPAGGVVVAELDGRTLEARGTISHASPYDTGCWNPLLRSIAIGDELVTVAADQLQFSDRQSLEPRDAVRWGDAEDYGCWWYWE